MSVGQPPIDKFGQTLVTADFVCLCQQGAFDRYSPVGYIVKVSDGRPVHIAQQTEYRRAEEGNVDKCQFKGRGVEGFTQEHGGKIRCRGWCGSADSSDR